MHLLKSNMMAIAAGTVAAAWSATASARTLDHLMCYKGGAESFAGAAVHLDDSGMSTVPGSANTFRLKKPKNLCVAASADSAAHGIADPVLNAIDSWTFYPAKRASGECSLAPAIACSDADDCTGNGECLPYETKFDSKSATSTARIITDGFAGLRVNFTKEVGVLAPAALGTLPPGPGSKDYYKCYAVKLPKALCNYGSLHGKACKSDSDCGGGFCQDAPAFPEEVFPSIGQGRTITSDRYSPSRTHTFQKVKMVCQAADKDGEGVVSPGAALLCYSTKSLSPPFTPPAPQIVSSAFDPNTAFELKKQVMFCNPACVEPFNHLVVRLNSVAIGSNGHAGNGLDIDGNGATCAPVGSCSGGIDNQMAALSSFVNPAIATAVGFGSINVLLDFDGFSNGTHAIAGYQGYSLPFCNDEGNPNEICTYTVAASSAATGNGCAAPGKISVPVTISGADTPPSATAIGGGPDATFSLSVNYSELGEPLTFTAKQVYVDLDLTHDGSDITSLSGAVGGAIPLVTLQSALSATSGTCTDGFRECHSDDECFSGCCEMISPCLDPGEVAALAGSLIAPDIDLDGIKNCIGGTNTNQPCDSIAECPDQDTGLGASCQLKESVSIGIAINAIDAEIVAVY